MSLIVRRRMWLEAVRHIVTSLHRDFLPSSWDMYYPTSGTSRPSSAPSAVVTLMFLFVRVLPMISIFEVRTLVPNAGPPEEDQTCRSERIDHGRHHATADKKSGIFGLMRSSRFDQPGVATRRRTRKVPRDGCLLAVPIHELIVRSTPTISGPAQCAARRDIGMIAGFGLCYWVSTIAIR